jgi:hypothetical protein
VKELIIMKKMTIYEPTMCCSTGLCGVSVDPELLRISTLMSRLNKAGTVVERYNLTNDPMAFVTNIEVNKLLVEKGMEVLPVTVVNGKVVKTAGYLSTKEILALLGLPENSISEEKTSAKTLKLFQKPRSGCGCGDGNCS